MVKWTNLDRKHTRNCLSHPPRSLNLTVGTRGEIFKVGTLPRLRGGYNGTGNRKLINNRNTCEGLGADEVGPALRLLLDGVELLVEIAGVETFLL